MIGTKKEQEVVKHLLVKEEKDVWVSALENQGCSILLSFTPCRTNKVILTSFSLSPIPIHARCESAYA